METIKQAWLAYEQKHPKLSQWIREGGLFIIVSNLITVFKYLLLQFLLCLVRQCTDAVVYL